MSERICDFRFAICDLTEPSCGLSPAFKPFSLTPCFSGVYKAPRDVNRSSGFKRAEQTAEAVRDPAIRDFHRMLYLNRTQ